MRGRPGSRWRARPVSATSPSSGSSVATGRHPARSARWPAWRPERADRELAAAGGLPVRAGLAARIRDSSDRSGRIERAMDALGGWIETPLDDTYPVRLHDLADPPPVLYGLGRRSAIDEPALVAVVGTRHPTGIGRDLAARIAARLAGAGVAVVSGLAVGIDAIAHSASLDVGGVTIGVAGSGLDRPAPRANDRLVRRILAADGALVSELAPGVLPTAGTFPRRNRIISVLASATIVVEAPARSARSSPPGTPSSRGGGSSSSRAGRSTHPWLAAWRSCARARLGRSSGSTSSSRISISPTAARSAPDRPAARPALSPLEHAVRVSARRRSSDARPAHRPLRPPSRRGGGRGHDPPAPRPRADPRFARARGRPSPHESAKGRPRERRRPRRTMWT